MITVDQNVMAVLDAAETIGNSLRLVGKLDRKLYERTSKILEAAGGKWNRKAQAHLFEGSAAEAIEPILLTGTVQSTKQEFGQFYTPPDLAARVTMRADLSPGMKVLEPSAGRGALAAPAFLTECLVDCVEIDRRNVEILCSTAYNDVVENDFLSIRPIPVYDRVVMNPPFAKQDDIRHVLHAHRFLKPGGQLVAIMAAGVKFRTNRLAEEFRAHLAAHSGTIEDLPPEAFKAAGTGVQTVLITLDAAE